MHETGTRSAATKTGSAGQTAVDRHWGVLCIFLVFAATAILHNVVFYYATCMLNPFGKFGNDYTSLLLLKVWLVRDPSLWTGMLVAHVAYHVGARRAVLRLVVAIFLVAFLPVTVWIWDIPFTDRVICYGLHDGRLKIGDFAVTSLHIYYFSGTMFVALLVVFRNRIKSALALA